MFAIFLMFTLYELLIFDVSLQELKKLLSTRNEGFTFNMMQDLDQRLRLLNKVIYIQRLYHLKATGQLKFRDKYIL